MTRHLVAVFVLLHLLATGLQALPSAGAGMDRRRWRDPTVQAELQAWRARLASVGWAMERDTFEDRLFAIAKGVESGREVVLGPVEPYLSATGSWQSWKMFVAPHRHPSRLVIEAEREGAWSVWYRRGDPDHAWQAAALDHDRMRAVQFRLAWAGYDRHLDRFAQAVATRVMAEDVGVTRVRVGYERRPTPRPAQVQAGEDVPWTPSRQRIVAAGDDGVLRVMRVR